MVLNVSQREFNTNSVVFVSFFSGGFVIFDIFQSLGIKFNLIFVCLSYDAFRIILFLPSAEDKVDFILRFMTLNFTLLQFQRKWTNVALNSIIDGKTSLRHPLTTSQLSLEAGS